VRQKINNNNKKQKSFQIIKIAAAFLHYKYKVLAQNVPISFGVRPKVTFHSITRPSLEPVLQLHIEDSKVSFF
jgi:hypothetical protein